MKNAREIVLKMINSPEEFSADTFISTLECLDDLYFNEGEVEVEDNEYDALKAIASRIIPHHKYFTGVGSAIRGGKVHLPVEMGSLDQIEIGEIEDWINKWSLRNEDIVISDKMDGTSALIIFDDNGDPQIAYSRGDGVSGADISRHIFKISNVPTNVSGSLVVRAEVEMSETSFQQLQSVVMSRSGKPYKNARNMVAGLMNAKENPFIVYEHLKVVAYEVIGGTVFRLTKGDVELSKFGQFEHLRECGFDVANYELVSGSEITDAFLADFLQQRRDVLDFAIDGLVLDVNHADKRAEMNPTRDTLNPAYSIKYKVADASNVAIATVVGVEWNVSKHSYLKPKIQIEPVDLVGVTIQNCTGFNAKFIYDNNIGPGAKIQVTRSGDVIPFCQKVIKGTVPAMPGSMNANEHDWDWDWNETGVDAVLKSEHASVNIQQTVDFFASIKAPFLKEGNVVKLVDAGFTSPAHIINASETELVNVVGSNGTKIFNGLRKVLTDIDGWKLIGATNFFGRGVGTRKFKKLFAGLQLSDFDELPLLNVSQITSVEGFEEKTARKIINGVGEFMSFWGDVQKNVSLAAVKQTTNELAGEKIVFTGFRNAEWQELVENKGGKMQSGISGQTTILVAKNPTSTSGKMKKARDLGIKIVGIEEFEGML